MKGKRARILQGAAALLLVFAACVLMIGRVRWLPVVGNLVSAARMRTYAAQVYPDLAQKGLWAGFDPEDSHYFQSFALKSGGGERCLYYDLMSGLVTDERRETALRKELGIARDPQIDGHMAYWQARWDPRDPDTPVVDIRIDFGDGYSAPVPDEEAMREAMADQAMALYEELSPRTPVRTVSVCYNHEAQENRHGGLLWHSITVDLPEDTPLTRERILSGTLVSR